MRIRNWIFYTLWATFVGANGIYLAREAYVYWAHRATLTPPRLLNQQVRPLRAALIPQSQVQWVCDTTGLPFGDWYTLGTLVAHELAPAELLVLGGEADTLVGYFPHSQSLQSPVNPLYTRRASFRVLKQYPGNFFLLQRR